MVDGAKFISGSLTALSVMVNLELPHVNVLSKVGFDRPSFSVVRVSEISERHSGVRRRFLRSISGTRSTKKEHITRRAVMSISEELFNKKVHHRSFFISTHYKLAHLVHFFGFFGPEKNKRKGTLFCAPDFQKKKKTERRSARAGHFRYFCIFSIIYQINDLFLHQSYLKSPLLVKLT